MIGSDSAREVAFAETSLYAKRAEETGGQSHSAFPAGRYRVEKMSMVPPPVQSRIFSLLLLLWFGFALSCWGYQREGSWLEGRITDKDTAAGVSNAEIIITDPEGRTVLHSQTDAGGRFVVAGIAPGEYELAVRNPLYPEYRLRRVEVFSECGRPLDVQMERQPATQNIVLILQSQMASEFESCRIERFARPRIENFPAAKNIWYWLQTQEPATVTEPIDEGGLHTGTIGLAGVNGRSWTQNGYRWDGLNITNPYQPGKPLTYALPVAIHEFRVASTHHSAEIASPGAEFQMTSRRGSSVVHGEAEAWYTGDPLQSSNLVERLRAFGFDTTPHFKRFPEAEASLGGPFKGLRDWSYFASLGFQHVSRVIPAFAALPETSVYSAVLRADHVLGQRDSIAMLASGQIVKNSHLGARPGIEPSATLLGNDRFELLHGHWTHRRSDRTVGGLSFGFSHSSPTDTLQRGSTRSGYTHLFTDEITGSAPLESDSALSRFSTSGWMESLRQSKHDFQHHLHLGFNAEESLATEERRAFQSLQLFLFPGNAPSEVAELNTPSHAMQRLRELSFFAGDDVQIPARSANPPGRSLKVVLHLGLNFDSSSASLPRQVSGPGTFAPERQFAGASDVISWHTLSPRAAVTMPLPRGFKDARVTAGYARYYHLLPASYADFSNPTALGGQLYRWIDRNSDLVFQPGEEGQLLRVFGSPSSSIDPHLRRPFTDEWLVAIDRDFSRDLSGHFDLFEHDSKRLVQAVNVGVPAAAYTPVTVLDPGDDGVPGTYDDAFLTVFNQDARTLGQDRYLLTNPTGLHSSSKGLQARLRGRFIEDGLFSLSFMAYKSVGNGNPGNSVFENDPNVIAGLFRDPNSLINSRGRLFFDRAYVAKAAVYQPLPFGFRVASVISYLDGLPFGRKLSIADFNQGPFFVMATTRTEGGCCRTEYSLRRNQRVSREFKIGNHRVAITGDIFNLLNLNKSLRDVDVTGPAFAQRKPIDVQNPRAFRMGVRISF
jgi:hypothetical protein